MTFFKIESLRISSRGGNGRSVMSTSGAVSLLLIGLNAPILHAQALTLESAIELAIQNDPWLKSNLFQEQGFRASAVSANQLPDPKLTLGLANLPTDSFDFHQEAMTQAVLGVSQSFPAGKTLELGSEKLSTKADQTFYARENRVAQLRQAISQIWVEMYRYEHTLSVLSVNKTLLESLKESLSSSYSARLNRVNQQALVNNELEIAKIDERAIQIQQSLQQAKAKLSQYSTAFQNVEQLQFVALTTELQAVKELDVSPDSLAQHPAVQWWNLQQDIYEIDQSLVEQQFKPQWTLNLGYGYRGSDLSGRERADLASVSVSMNLPFFSRQRLDADTKAAISSQSSAGHERDLKLNELSAQLQSVQSDLMLLEQRVKLYQNTLLPGYRKSYEVALNAYRSSESSYRDVMLSKIMEMNARIELIQLQSDQFKRLTDLQYLATQSLEGAQS